MFAHLQLSCSVLTHFIKKRVRPILWFSRKRSPYGRTLALRPKKKEFKRRRRRKLFRLFEHRKLQPKDNSNIAVRKLNSNGNRLLRPYGPLFEVNLMSKLHFVLR